MGNTPTGEIFGEKNRGGQNGRPPSCVERIGNPLGPFGAPRTRALVVGNFLGPPPLDEANELPLGIFGLFWGGPPKLAFWALERLEKALARPGKGNMEPLEPRPQRLVFWGGDTQIWRPNAFLKAPPFWGPRGKLLWVLGFVGPGPRRWKRHALGQLGPKAPLCRAWGWRLLAWCVR